MSESVKLYVYDLSQGMARSMSRSLTGKQIGKHCFCIFKVQLFM